jgi:hypothetical protein
MSKFERGDTVTVRGYNGIAWTVLGQSMTGYVDEVGDEHEDVLDGWWDVRMVGDDKVWTLEASMMALISDDDYCQGCGQIGCAHGSQF